MRVLETFIASVVAWGQSHNSWAHPQRRRRCVEVADVTTTSTFWWYRWRLVTQCTLDTFRANMFSPIDRRRRAAVHYMRRLRRLRSVTTSARRRRISNKLKTRAKAVTSWLRRDIMTPLAQSALPRRNSSSTAWCAEVASKMGILSVATSSSRRTTSVSDLAKKVAGHQGLQLQKVVGPDEKL